MPRDRAKVAEELDKFIVKVESLWGTESPPINLATQMLQASSAPRPSAVDVLQHCWLAPPLFRMDATPLPMQPRNQAAPLNEAPSLSSEGRPTASHPTQPVSEAAPLKGALLPSSGGPAQPTSQAAALKHCLLYTSPSPRDLSTSRMPSSA